MPRSPRARRAAKSRAWNEITNQIVRILDPHRIPNQRFWNPHRLPLGARALDVTRRRRRASHRFHGAEIRREVRETQPGEKCFHRLEVALESEAEHSPKTAHLPRGRGMTLVGLEPRVVDVAHERMTLEKARDLSALSFC